MNKKEFNPMPPEYEFLNAPLLEAQEHVFLIDTELQRLEGNSLNEYKIVKLQDERQNVLLNLKNDFEMQTWENGPEFTEHIHGIVDDYLSAESYEVAKDVVVASGKTYDMSTYWQDKFDRNRAEWAKQFINFHEFDKEELGSPDFLDDYDDFERD